MADRRFRTVLDGLEDIWDGSARGWRATADAQSELGRRNAEMLRRAAESVIEGSRRAGVAAAALLADRRSKEPPAHGPVDLDKVNQRMAESRADIRNLRAGTPAGFPEAADNAGLGAVSMWVGKVQPGGRWDDKAHAETKAEKKKLERQGNFSYGATAAALGIPRQIALRGAGGAQRLGRLGEALKGRPQDGLRPGVGNLFPPYGDDPRDQTPIVEGYEYGSRRERAGQ